LKKINTFRSDFFEKDFNPWLFQKVHFLELVFFSLPPFSNFPALSWGRKLAFSSVKEIARKSFKIIQPFLKRVCLGFVEEGIG
jgi:hypothetical protein